jgi:hypothetical protein
VRAPCLGPRFFPRKIWTVGEVKPNGTRENSEFQAPRIVKPEAVVRSEDVVLIATPCKVRIGVLLVLTLGIQS